MLKLGSENDAKTRAGSAKRVTFRQNTVISISQWRSRLHAGRRLHTYSIQASLMPNARSV
jgi:hypothetical protein